MIKDDEKYEYRILTKYLADGVRLELYTKGNVKDKYVIDSVLGALVIGSDKHYSGEVYINLEDEKTVYYDVEGEMISKEKILFITLTKSNHVSVSSRVYIPED